MIRIVFEGEHTYHEHLIAKPCTAVDALAEMDVTGTLERMDVPPPNTYTHPETGVRTLIHDPVGVKELTAHARDTNVKAVAPGAKLEAGTYLLRVAVPASA